MILEQLLKDADMRKETGEEGYKMMYEKLTEEVFMKNMCNTQNKAWEEEVKSCLRSHLSTLL
jgi:hypothetical protein